MAHDLWYQNGRHSMFVVGDKDAAWHKLGQRTDKAVSWQEAMQLANLNWTVEKRKLYARTPAGQIFEIPDKMGIFRNTDSAYLGTVGDGYEPIQNITAFEFIDTLLEALNGAHYDSAGALGNGSRIWAAAKVPCDFEVTEGDRHETYLLFSTSHDGSLAANCKLTVTRVVCNNTLTAALRESNAMCRVRHTRSAADKLERARQLMQGVRQNVTTLADKLKLLATRRMTRDTMTTILDRLFPKNQEAERDTRRENILADVLRMYESNDRNQFPQERGTAFNLLNAVTEYTDHVRSARVTASKADYSQLQARAESAVFGSGESLKNKALDVILEATNGAQVIAPMVFPSADPPIGGLLGDVIAQTN